MRTAQTLLAATLALVLGGNGVVMLVAGAWWYGVVPGVPLTGPFNAPFVKDIGAAYLVAGGALAAFAWRPARAWPALAAASAFLVLHAGVHVADALASPTCGHDLVRDLPGVFAPALISLGLLAAAFRPSMEVRHA